MKELSVKEKAKHYDEALERYKAKQEYECQKVHEFIEYLFPELKESEDERIRKALIRYFTLSDEHAYNEACGVSYRDIVAWLEKQGEQKPVDKVGQKFKVGDWVVFNNKHQSIYQVEKVEDGYYILRHTHGGTFRVCVLHDENLRLWTIQDAKCGDVLSDGTTIFIFKDLLSDGSVMSYCDYDTDSGESDAFCPLSVNLMCPKITPASKEQRDLLFKKMKEAGYEWDANKKELKKIEQQPDEQSLPYRKNETAEKLIALAECLEMEGDCLFNRLSGDDYGKLLRVLAKELTEVKPAAWSEEDKSAINVLKSIIKKSEMIDSIIYTDSLKEKLYNWLKSIKDRVQPKQEWSEEDEKEVAVLEAYIRSNDWSERHIDRALGIVDELVNKVKSLRPQKQWKPSEEQMAALEAMLTASPQSPAITSALLELHEQLKKL